MAQADDKKMDIKPTNFTPVLPGSADTLPARNARADLDALRPADTTGV